MSKKVFYAVVDYLLEQLVLFCKRNKTELIGICFILVFALGMATMYMWLWSNNQIVALL